MQSVIRGARALRAARPSFLQPTTCTLKRTTRTPVVESRRNMSSFEFITADPSKAPAGAGPYSQAIKAGNLVFCSGSLGVEPHTGKLVPGGVSEQALQALTNLKAVVEASGAQLSQVIRCGVFLADMNDFATINKIYEDFFEGHKPTRTCVQVAKLPLGGLFEIDCVCVV